MRAKSRGRGPTGGRYCAVASACRAGAKRCGSAPASAASADACSISAAPPARKAVRSGGGAAAPVIPAAWARFRKLSPTTGP